MDETKKSIIVVADTHFGLDQPGQAADPKAFADFLKWIKQLEENGKETLKTGPWVSIEESMPLLPPEKIILLGDILELWDASSKSIDISTRYIIQLLSELNCEKIYVLGNHDHELAEVGMRYPLGPSDVRIIENECWVSKGTENYCFLHGHQFDKLFVLPSWTWMAPIRKAALAFGSYTWVLAALFAADLAFETLGGFRGIADLVLLVLLGAISIPFLIIQFGRKGWNSLKTVKYNPEYARMKALLWKKFPEGLDKKGQNITIVYGHTHAIDFWAEVAGGNILTLMNIPSWIRVFPKYSRYRIPYSWRRLQASIENELYHAFLYITEDGCEFIGWDDQKKKPYLIPKQLIQAKRECGDLGDHVYLQYLLENIDLIEHLIELGWPKPIIRKWVGKEYGGGVPFEAYDQDDSNEPDWKKEKLWV